MNFEQAIELGREAVMMTLMIGAPVMVIAVVVGLIISIMQAVTQIQDQTLSFVPKIIAMILTLLIFLPWIMERMTDYASNLYRNIPTGL